MPTKLVETLKDKKVHVNFRASDELTSYVNPSAWATIASERLTPKTAILHLGHMDVQEETIAGEHKAQHLHALHLDVIFHNPEEKKQAEELANKEKKHEANEEAKIKYKVEIPVSHVHDVKARDYREGFTEHRALHVILQSEESMAEPMKVKQVLLFFHMLEDRDNWFDGLQSLCDRRWAEEVPHTENKLHLIKKITERIPAHDEIIKFEVTILEHKKPEIFKVLKSDVRDKTQGSAKLKELVEDFVLHNFILPAEGVSLYRYARALISRLHMEEAVEEITKEVDKLRWKPEQIQKLHPQEIRKREKTDADNLAKLKQSLLDRVGRHGPGAPLIIKVLERSIEKVKQYNLYHRHSILGSRGVDSIEDTAEVDS